MNLNRAGRRSLKAHARHTTRTGGALFDALPIDRADVIARAPEWARVALEEYGVNEPLHVLVAAPDGAGLRALVSSRAAALTAARRNGDHERQDALTALVGRSVLVELAGEDGDESFTVELD